MPRGIELALIFFLTPVIFVGGLVPVRFIMVLLLLAALWAIWVVKQHKPPEDVLGLGAANRRNFLPVLTAGLIAWALSLSIVLTVRHHRQIPVAPGFTSNQWFTLALAVVYTASAAAQEVLFRSFFFWRYRGLLPLWALFVVNAISFGWIHIVFGSWLSVGLSFAGGLLFAGLYLWRRSLGGVVAIHALFGFSAFATGLGEYFYHGSAQVAHLLSAR